MKQLNNIQKDNLKEFILIQLDTNYYDYESKTDKDKVQFVLNCFDKEYNFFNNKKRYPNLVTRFSEWLQGLPGVFEVPFYYDQILQIGLRFGLINPGRTEDEEETFLNNWFELCAAAFFDLAKDLGINTNYLK